MPARPLIGITLSGTMRSLSFSVHEVHQTSSVDHVVIYRAVLELSGEAGPVKVDMVSVEPPEASARDVQQAIEYARRGAERALDGRGGILHLSEFVIHPVDFDPRKVEAYTFREISGLIKSAG